MTRPGRAAAAAKGETYRAIATYFAAFFACLWADALVVAAAAWGRSAGNRSDISENAVAFALSRTGLLAIALANAVVLVAAAVFSVRRGRAPGESLFHALRLRGGSLRPGAAIAVVLGLLGVSLSSSACAEALGASGRGTMGLIASALHALGPGEMAVSVLVLGLAPGMAEETFFRGFLQTRLVAAWGRWPGIFATSAAFGIIHLDPVQGAVAAVAGLYLGWVSEEFDSIAPAVVAHAANNALFVSMASMASGASGSRGGTLLLAFAIGLLLTGAAVLFVRRVCRFATSVAAMPAETPDAAGP